MKKELRFNLTALRAAHVITDNLNVKHKPVSLMDQPVLLLVIFITKPLIFATMTSKEIVNTYFPLLVIVMSLVLLLGTLHTMSLCPVLNN